ncbi:hypothetical protein [Ruegeria hyattellae]|uniref:hypothetical protein n=1 Tax=Ruegeria hyattellae TaxID=3233337 RepID=UPI00355C2CA4
MIALRALAGREAVTCGVRVLDPIKDPDPVTVSFGVADGISELSPAAIWIRVVRFLFE